MDMKQCLDCQTVSVDMEFNEGCPDCHSQNIVEYDGDVMQCSACGYIAGADEFCDGTGDANCPECKSDECYLFEE